MKDPNPEATQLASDLFEARRQLRTAGRALHDEAGSLLSSAGLRLQLLRMDLPESKDAVEETLALLEEALQGIRVMSQQLNSSPSAHLGLQRALSRLVEQMSESFAGTIRFAYTAVAKPTGDADVAIYDAVAAVLRDAVAAGRTRAIRISVTGARDLAVRISIAGWKWARSAASIQARRAAPAGVDIQVTAQFVTEKSTIVSIRYALRRPASG